jgi:hypothetical protein
MTIEISAAGALAPVAGYVAIYRGQPIAISLYIQLLRIAPRERVQKAE